MPGPSSSGSCSATVTAPSHRLLRSRLLLLGSPVLFLLVFFVWPLLVVTRQSVPGLQAGAANYLRVLTEPPYLLVLFRTLGIAGTVTAACLVLAYPLAAFIAWQEGIRLKLLVALVLTPLWTSVVIRSYAWMILFQRNGVVNQALTGLGLADEPVQILQTLPAVEIAMVHILLPFMVLPLLASMRGIDRTLLRAGQVMGAPPWRLFVRVFLPLTRHGVANGVTLVFITALGFYVTPALLGGGRGTMMAMLIEQQVSTYFDWPLASALATLLMAVTVIIYGLYSWLARGGPRAARR